MIKKKQTALFSLTIIYFYLILTIAVITLGLAGFCFYYYKSNGVQGVQTRLKRKDRFESK